jgi:hypothetical protein
MSEKEFPSAFADFIDGLDIDDFDGKKSSSSAAVPTSKLTWQGVQEEIGTPKNNWTIEEVALDRVKKQAIRYGDATLFYDQLNNSEQLSWRAVLPIYLIPGVDGRSLRKFEQLFFHQLPLSMGLAPKDESESIRRYQTASSIAFHHTGIKEPQEYDFVKDGEFYNFAADFMRLPEEFHPISLRVRGRFMAAPSPQVAYNLRIDYHTIDRRAGEINIFLPSNQSRENPKWTPELLQFVIDTHENKNAFWGEAGVADDLSEVLMQLPRKGK